MKRSDFLSSKVNFPSSSGRWSTITAWVLWDEAGYDPSRYTEDGAVMGKIIDSWHDPDYFETEEFIEGEWRRK